MAEEETRGTRGERCGTKGAENRAAEAFAET